MPYTPPAKRSPARKVPVAVDGENQTTSTKPTDRPSIPRSASYLMRQPRRSNSYSERDLEQIATTNAVLNSGSLSESPKLANISPISQTTPPGTSEDLYSLVKDGILRQSPPPVTDARALPKGAITTPPESSSSSSDEGEVSVRGRQRERGIKELQDALTKSQIPQGPPLSPHRKPSFGDNGSNNSAVISEGMHHSLSTGSLSGLAGNGRRISHAKSNTEPKIVLSQSLGPSLTVSEDETEEDFRAKPPMVRKKSGELVRPALRASSRKRPSSMPGTPTFSKNVHFNSHLEEVRHFCDIDRPSAVSAGSSPVDVYDTDDEYPFPSSTRKPPSQLELAVHNFPSPTPFRQSKPVRTERIWLSNDQKSLMGSVVVANLAFQKSVVCRFTMDYWKTTSEVSADYDGEVHPRESPMGHDRFKFSIKLSETSNLESKTLYFCVRYNVNGAEYWDNNENSNFQVDFRKKLLPQNGKRGFQGASSRPTSGLPRSSRRSPSGSPRKSSATSSLNDFRSQNKVEKKSLEEMLDDSESFSGLRLKGVKSTSSLTSDNLPAGVGAPSGQAFSNRYDFSASLSAAKQAAKTTPTRPENDNDGLYMKPNRREAATSSATAPRSPRLIVPSSHPKPVSPLSVTVTRSPQSQQSAASYQSPGSTIANSSYEEILHKYCFYGSKSGSPQPSDIRTSAQSAFPRRAVTDNQSANATERQSGGSGNISSLTSSSSSSPDVSPHREPTAQHHSLFPTSHQYFHGLPLSLGSSMHSPSTQSGSRSNSPALGNGFTPLTAPVQ